MTAIDADFTEKELADDDGGGDGSFYMDTGHALDLHNKAIEVLNQIGSEHRAQVLPSLLPAFGNAERNEELISWQSPADLVTPLREAFERLKGIHFGEVADAVDQIRGDDPRRTVTAMTESLEQGMTPERLAQLVALAAAERIERVHLQNEFGDWIRVLHTFTHTHAVR